MLYKDLLEKTKQNENKVVYGREQRKAFLDAFAQNKNIHIICDYDADGICSGLIMTRICEAMGAKVKVTVGNRTDGYGIPTNLDLEKGELVICCDLGSNEKDRLNEIYKATGKVPYVIDHHVTDETHSHILNPPKGNFCTSGLCTFLALECNIPTNVKLNMDEIIKLGCIGTVADMCEMINPYDFNREIVKNGLLKFESTSRRTGIENLIAECKLNHKYATTDDIAFTLAPAINAYGRMENNGAEKVFDILRNNGNVTLLLDKNKERKELMKGMSSLWENRLKEDVMIVVAPKDTKKGVLGLIAQEVLKAYDTPSICIAKDGEYYTGSCRNAKGYPPMLETLSSIPYIEVGGHDSACGIRIAEKDLGRFANDIQELYKGITREEVPTPEPLEDWKNLSVDEVYELEPFGIDFPKPYIDDKVTVVGRSDFKNNYSSIMTAEGVPLFGQNIPETKKGETVSIKGTLGLSTDFRGATTKRINVTELSKERELQKDNNKNEMTSR